MADKKKKLKYVVHHRKAKGDKKDVPTPTVVGIGWFTDDNGFSDADRDEINGLDSGETYSVGDVDADGDGGMDIEAVEPIDESLQRARKLAGLPPLVEGKVGRYDSSIDFESDVSELEQHFKAIEKILRSSAWKQWMRDTDSNFSGAKSAAMSSDIEKKTKEAHKALDDFYDHMISLS